MKCSRHYFPTESPWDSGAQQHALPFLEGTRLGYFVNIKQSNSTEVSSVSDGTNQVHQKAQIIKKVCVCGGGHKLLTFAETTDNAMTSTHPLYCHSASMSEQIPVYRTAQND